MWKMLFWSAPVLILLTAACATRPELLGPEISAEELVQRAQEASDRSRYRLALQYYGEILARFPQNPEMVCTAEYEIAFVRYKQKKYSSAKAGLNGLLARYNGSDEELYPKKFKILCTIVLKRIEEKEEQQQRIKNFFKNPFGTAG
jgi:outer membrane protein assembly factor BamD (BamD/ComL family)